MDPFVHVNATSVADAVAKLDSYGGKAKALAGGTDLLNAMVTKINVVYPPALVNLKSIPNLNNITLSGQTMKIGSLAKLADIASSSTVKTNLPSLAAAANAVATPHVRNMATLGGNLCQAVSCWYYRYPNRLGGRIVCYRKGGTSCYAAAGVNTYHSIFGAPKGCFAVYPSDTAPALVALNASVVTSARTIPIESFFDAFTGTVLANDEIVTEVDVPVPAAGTKQVFLKFAQRKSIDFAVASVAALVTLNGTTCTAARIALGGVAPTPLRSTAAENAIIGKTLDATAVANAAAAATSGSTPLAYNAYKVPVVQSLVTQALTS